MHKLRQEDIPACSIKLHKELGSMCITITGDNTYCWIIFIESLYKEKLT
jgi:hypothetical protein